MQFLILGASGLVGSAIKKQLEEYGHSVVGTYHAVNETCAEDESFVQYTVGNELGMDALLAEASPDVIVSAIRGEFDLQMQTHERVMEYCKSDKSKKIIFISTVNVFDNDLSKIHTESDKLNPESTYGHFKAQCEEMFLTNLEKSQVIILRIPSVWNANCRRVQELKDAAKNGNTVKVWTPLIHNYTTPTKIVEAILYILEKELVGVFHLGSEETMDYTEFYRNVTGRLGIAEDVLEVEELSDKTENLPWYQCLASERKDFVHRNAYSIEEILTEVGEVILGGAYALTRLEF